MHHLPKIKQTIHLAVLACVCLFLGTHLTKHGNVGSNISHVLNALAVAVGLGERHEGRSAAIVCCGGNTLVGLDTGASFLIDCFHATGSERILVDGVGELLHLLELVGGIATDCCVSGGEGARDGKGVDFHRWMDCSCWSAFYDDDEEERKC